MFVTVLGDVSGAIRQGKTVSEFVQIEISELFLQSISQEKRDLLAKFVGNTSNTKIPDKFTIFRPTIIYNGDHLSVGPSHLPLMVVDHERFLFVLEEKVKIVSDQIDEILKKRENYKKLQRAADEAKNELLGC